MNDQPPRYGLRADHTRRIYEVYEIATGKTVESYRYHNESSRGTAHGRGILAREFLNRNGEQQ